MITRIMITGANAGLGKETARQLAMKDTTTRIILACRNPQKAEAAKADLERITGKKIFQTLTMDVSDADSVYEALDSFTEPIDALVMNAGGMGGRTPEKMTPSGMNTLGAANVLGHAILLEEMIERGQLKETAIYVSSEAARGIKKMGMKRPELKSFSSEEFASVLDGSLYGKAFDAMQAYGAVKFTGTMWMSSLARKYPDLRLLSISPGGTSGTEGADDLPLMNKIMFKYIFMPIVLPMRGMLHSLETGTKRLVRALFDDDLKSGRFYASVEETVVGKIIDQSEIFPELDNPVYQDNAAAGVRSFIKEELVTA